MNTEIITIPENTNVKQLLVELNQPKGAKAYRFSPVGGNRPIIGALKDITDICGVSGKLEWGKLVRKEFVSLVPEFHAMTIKEMVEWHNARSAKPVKKFSDHKTAVRRCEALYSDTVETVTRTSVPKKGVKRIVKQNKPKATTPEELHAARSAGIAESWKNPEVAAKRAKKQSVIVDGTEYRSVRAAFIELELPLKEHISFRMILKANKTASDYGHDWKIVDA